MKVVVLTLIDVKNMPLTGSVVRVKGVLKHLSKVCKVTYFIPKHDSFWVLKKFNSADIIFIEHFGIIPVVYKSLLKTKTPLVYEYHSFWQYEDDISLKTPLELQEEKEPNKMETEICQKAAAVFAFSTQLKDDLIKRGIRSDKIYITYPGTECCVDCKPIDLKKSPDDFIVMYGGNASGWQGLDMLLEAFEKADIPGKKLFLIGNHLLNDNQITSLGIIDNELIQSYFMAADILVIPRRKIKATQTMPQKFAEYLSAGKPLLVTDISDNKAIIDKYNCGYVVDPASDSIKNGLEWLYRNPEARNRMGGNARCLAQGEFNVENVVQKIYERFCALLKK